MSILLGAGVSQSCSPSQTSSLELKVACPVLELQRWIQSRPPLRFPPPPHSNLRVCKLSKQEAQSFYAVHQGKPFYDALTDFMSSGRICAMELTGPNAIETWRQLLGPTDSDAARQQVRARKCCGHCNAVSYLRSRTSYSQSEQVIFILMSICEFHSKVNRNDTEKKMRLSSHSAM